MKMTKLQLKMYGVAGKAEVEAYAHKVLVLLPNHIAGKIKVRICSTTSFYCILGKRISKCINLHLNNS